MVGVASRTFPIGTLQISEELNTLWETLHETQDQLTDIYIEFTTSNQAFRLNYGSTQYNHDNQHTQSCHSFNP
jgi:hypothetical protein